MSHQSFRRLTLALLILLLYPAVAYEHSLLGFLAFLVVLFTLAGLLSGFCKLALLDRLWMANPSVRRVFLATGVECLASVFIWVFSISFGRLGFLAAITALFLLGAISNWAAVTRALGSTHGVFVACVLALFVPTITGGVFVLLLFGIVIHD